MSRDERNIWLQLQSKQLPSYAQNYDHYCLGISVLIKDDNALSELKYHTTSCCDEFQQLSV